MSDSSKRPITIVVSDGVAGPSVYLNNRRVAGPKPWGAVRTLHEFKTNVREIREAIPELADKAPEIARLRVQLAAARDALAPFAKHAKKYDSPIYPDSHWLLGQLVAPSIVVGDFRRASRALTVLTSPAQPGAETMETPDV